MAAAFAATLHRPPRSNAWASGRGPGVLSTFQHPASGSGPAALQAQSIGRFDSPSGPRFDGGTPALTRRRYPDAPEECWHISYGDVHVGVIAIRTGSPHDEDPWGWNCGFYPGSHPGECASGTAASFDEARADFEGAWKVFLSNRTEADFQAWSDQRDWTERKYAMWARGEKLPSQIFSFDDNVPLRRGFR
jgi:hypothetical protein